jgi:hypothetical protein
MILRHFRHLKKGGAPCPKGTPMPDTPMALWNPHGALEPPCRRRQPVPIPPCVSTTPLCLDNPFSVPEPLQRLVPSWG